ncbi:MAG: bacillithiol system redox-active protein YtxJ [Bacteroidia bacterium]
MTSQLHWKALCTTEDLDALILRSHEVPVAIFKHSTTCGISAYAKHQLESDWSLGDDAVEMYYLDLHSYRPVSNLVAERLGVWHQSPQIILLRAGKVVYHTSHSAISVRGLGQALAA